MFIIIITKGGKVLKKPWERKVEPAYSSLQYFSMTFSAGVAVGMFVFGVAEPLFHFLEDTGANRFSGAAVDVLVDNMPITMGGLNENQKANAALLITTFHW